MKEGWIQTPLDNVCTFENGDRGKNYPGRKTFVSAGIPFINAGHLLADGTIAKEEMNYIPRERFELLSKGRVRPGDVLFCLRGSLGKAALVSEGIREGAIASSLVIVRSKPSLDVRFLLAYFKSQICKDMISRFEGGAAQPNLSAGSLKKFVIPLPPLSEQKRIVAILDEAFTGITQAVVNAEKNLANARELFESYLNSIITRKGEGWVDTKLGNEIELLTGFAFKSKAYTDSPDGVRLLRGDNIVQGSFRWANVKLWSKDDVESYKQYFLRDRDIVLAMDRTWVKAGLKFAQVSEPDLPCLLVQRVARLRTKSDLDCYYLKHLIGSGEFTRYVLSIQTGLGVPHISGPQIKVFPFSRPPLSVQKTISTNLSKLDEKIQRLNAIYQQKLTALAELKQSLLQKAFSGELTAEDDKLMEEAAA